MNEKESSPVRLKDVFLGLTGLWGFALVMVIAWSVYSSFLYFTFIRWSGISPNENLFNLAIFFTSFAIILGLNAILNGGDEEETT